jgi:competence ComEA-like helix-hairpin-helix protein
MRSILSRIDSWFAMTGREKTVVAFLIVSLVIGKSVVLIRGRRNRFLEELVTQGRTTTDQLLWESDSLLTAGREYVKIDINRATADELELLPGIGEATARKIVASRERDGPFREPRDLMRVSGIGEAKYAAIEASIVVSSPDTALSGDIEADPLRTAFPGSASPRRRAAGP